MGGAMRYFLKALKSGIDVTLLNLLSPDLPVDRKLLHLNGDNNFNITIMQCIAEN